MADGTFQHGTDTILTDDLANRNGAPFTGQKAQVVKVGYGPDGDIFDVMAAQPLPSGLGFLDVPLVAGQTTFTTAANGTAIDCQGMNWMTIQMTAGYTGMTSLTVQGSNDGVSFNSLAISSVGSTSSGLTTALGTSASHFTGPIPTRYIRFVPVGTGTGGTLTLTVRLFSGTMVLPSQGANANLSAIGNDVAPAIGLVRHSIGTSTQNAFQIRATGTADQAATALIAAVSGQMPYVTEIHTTVHHTASGATPRRFQVVGASSALIEQNILCPGPGSESRMFRNPWKPLSATNIAVNLAVTSIGAAVGTWDLVIMGYYQSS